jgi:hypothetical protein
MRPHRMSRAAPREPRRGEPHGNSSHSRIRHGRADVPTVHAGR